MLAIIVFGLTVYEFLPKGTFDNTASNIIFVAVAVVWLAVSVIAALKIHGTERLEPVSVKDVENVIGVEETVN